MIRALSYFFSSYSHFTVFLAYNKLRVKNRMLGLWPEILSTKRSHSNYNVPTVSVKTGPQKIYILWEKCTFFEDLSSHEESINFDWNFRHMVFTMRPLRAQNFRSKFQHSVFPAWLVIGQNVYLMREVSSQKLFITCKGSRVRRKQV